MPTQHGKLTIHSFSQYCFMSLADMKFLDSSNDMDGIDLDWGEFT